MNLCPGDVLAMRYKVKRRIGGGSFGEIYLGKYTTNHHLNNTINPNSFK
jgi:hypothetical protein